MSGAQLSSYATFLLHPAEAPLAIVLTALSTAAGAAVTPALALLLLGALLPVDAACMARSIVQVVLFPVAAGAVLGASGPVLSKSLSLSKPCPNPTGRRRPGLQPARAGRGAPGAAAAGGGVAGGHLRLRRRLARVQHRDRALARGRRGAAAGARAPGPARPRARTARGPSSRTRHAVAAVHRRGGAPPCVCTLCVHSGAPITPHKYVSNNQGWT